MTMNTRSVSTLLISLTLCGACVQEVGDAAEPLDAPHTASASGALSLESDDLDKLSENGLMWNGVKINGVKINGVKINGVKINGVKINGTILSGVALSDFHIDGTMLSGTTTDGTPVTWEDFKNSTMIAVTEDGSDVTLRIGDIKPRADDPEILDYALYYQVGGNGWMPACGKDGNKPIPAIPLTGTWNYNEGVSGGGSYIETSNPPMFTFACRSSVLEKCVSLGYKPWDVALETKGNQSQARPLRPFHQACTRMMRADYCGDGTPHTVENTKIDVWDLLKIEEEEENWELEAEWGMDGATCVRHVRWTSDGAAGVAEALSDIQTKCPWLSPSSSCGSQSSTFHATHGWSTPLDERSLFRNSSCVPTGNNGCVPGN